MKKITALALVSLLFVSLDAQAELFHLSYTGTINNMFIGDCTTPEETNCNFDIINVTSSDFFKGNLISIDDTFSGSFTIDSTQDFVLAGDDLRHAIYRNVLSGFSLQLAGLNIPQEDLPLVTNSFSNSVSIVDDRVSVGRTIDLFQSSQKFSSDEWFGSTNVTLIDNSANLFDDFSVPTTINVDSYDSGRFRFGFLERASSDQLQIQGDISTLSYERLLQVHTPSTLYLFIFMSLTIVLFKKKHGL